ncbi:MAG: hypothetical protein ACE5GW_08370 [Planctomycetota bacterium]
MPFPFDDWQFCVASALAFAAAWRLALILAPPTKKAGSHGNSGGCSRCPQ